MKIFYQHRRREENFLHRKLYFYPFLFNPFLHSPTHREKMWKFMTMIYFSLLGCCHEFFFVIIVSLLSWKWGEVKKSLKKVPFFVPRVMRRVAEKGWKKLNRFFFLFSWNFLHTPKDASMSLKACKIIKINRSNF